MARKTKAAKPKATRLLTTCCGAEPRYAQDVRNHHNEVRFVSGLTTEDLEAVASGEGDTLGDLVDDFGPIQEGVSNDGGDFYCPTCNETVEAEDLEVA